MKNISLIELREFLLTLPDDHPIDMVNGTSGVETSCLMTQYGESIGLQFDRSQDYCSIFNEKEPFSWILGNLTVAKMTEDRSVFTLFKPWNSDLDSKANRKVAGFWKTRLLPLV